MAGDDTKLLETLSRYKTEADMAKAFMEQRKKLSERPSVITHLPDGATPEQIAEFRKARGVPDKGTMEAYGVKTPDGYDLSEGEHGVLEDFVSSMHEKNYGPREVQDVLDQYFQAQESGLQAMRKVAADKQQEWQQALKTELGRDYDASIASAEAYLNSQFDGDEQGKAALLRAQLPGGGFLGDHPKFIKMLVDLATQNGYSDHIEANSMESAGKSLEQQQLEIEALRTSNSQLYNSPQMQAKLDKIIALRVSRGEIDELGNPIRRRR